MRKKARLVPRLQELLSVFSLREPGSDETDARREVRDARFYRAGFVLAAVYVLFGVVLNYDANFANIELSYLWLPMYFRRGLGLGWSDFRLSSDLEVLDYTGRRGRYLSWLLGIWNAKLRVFLERFVPPHPSFSFTWIFTVVLAPILLFKLMERLSGKRSTAWACAALYLLSPGFLSGITMLMQIGKPLAHLGIILALLLASRPKLGGGIPLETLPTRRWAALGATLFLSCTFGDTGWFAAAAVTVLFCAGIPRTRRQAATIIALFAPLLFFLALLCIPDPSLPHEPFWRLALQHNDQFRNGSIDLARNSYYLLGSHFLSFSAMNAGAAWAPYPFLAAFGLLAWLWSRGVETAQRTLLIRTALLLAAYLLFHAITMSPHPVVVTIYHCCFYYGTLTSLFLAMFFSVLLTAQDSARGRAAAKIFFSVWAIALAAHFRGIDQFWKYTVVSTSQETLTDWGHGRRDVLAGPSFREVMGAWRARRDPAALTRLRLEYPQSAYWLFNELDFVAAADAAELAQRRLRLPGRIYYDQCVEAANAGSLAKGLALCQASAWINPPDPLAHIETGYLYDLKGDSDRAIEQYQDAASLDPKNADARNNLGFALLRKGRPHEAVSQLREAVKLAPQNQLARNNLAAALSKLGLASGNPAKKPSDRSDSQALYERGLAAVNAGALDEGLALLLASIAANPRNIDAHFEAGYAYTLKRDVDRAIAQTQAAVALDPKLVSARNNLGFLLEQKGRYREAVDEFQEAVKLDPGNQLARNNLAAALAKLGAPK